MNVHANANDDNRVLRILKQRAVCYPVAFPAPMTNLHMTALLSRYAPLYPSVTAIARFSWIAGQRLSDMLQLACEDIQTTDHHLVVTVRRGKVLHAIQPYTIHLNKSEATATALLAAKREALSHGLSFLISQGNEPAVRSSVKQLIAMMLLSVDERLELRSFRRGGLQAMAANGLTLEEIRRFSMHKSDEMLLRYLNWGTCMTHMASAMSGSISQMEAMLL
jgi:integrase